MPGMPIRRARMAAAAAAAEAELRAGLEVVPEDPGALDRELLRFEHQRHRVAARRSLLEFCTYVRPWFEVSQHHALMCEKLEAVERGELDRLMIFAPPRHSKSEVVSRCFPAWFMGRNPRRSVIATSYAGDMSGDLGADVRQLVREPEYGQVWPGVRMSEDEQARDRWKIEYQEGGRVQTGGRYHAAGVGGQVTGRGGHLLLIDDPHKSVEEAGSVTMRDRVYQWYLADLYTRQAIEGAAIVMILTRWDVDDLAGRLLRDQESGGDVWEVLSLPAVSEGEGDPLGRPEGAALWPARFPRARLDRIRRTLTMQQGPRHWEALYQQRPVQREGNLIKTAWLEPFMYGFGQHPAGMPVYLSSDYAVTPGRGNCTVHMAWGVDGRSHLWLLDVWRKQADTLEWCLAFIQMLRQWEPTYCCEEVGQIRKSVGPFLDRLMREHETYAARSSEDGKYVPTASKAARARSITGRMQMGMVHVPRDAPWTGALVDELLQVTGQGDEQDDQVDCFSLIGLHLAEMEGDEERPAKVRTKRDYGDGVGGWRETFRRTRERQATQVGTGPGALTAYVAEHGLSRGWSPYAEDDEEDEDLEEEEAVEEVEE